MAKLWKYTQLGFSFSGTERKSRRYIVGVVASHSTHLPQQKNSQDSQSFSHNKYVIQEIMKQVEQLQNKEPCSLRSTLLVGNSKNRSPCVQNTSVHERIFSQTFTQAFVMIPAKDPKPVRSLQMFRTFSLTSCSDIVNSLDIHGEQLNFMYFATPRTAALLLGRKTQTFSGTNQKPKRLQLSGTMSPGALLPIGYFSLRHLFQPSRLSLAPTICPWVYDEPPPHFRGRKLLPLLDLLVFPYSLQPKSINIHCFPGNVLLYTITAEKKSSLNF